VLDKTFKLLDQTLETLGKELEEMFRTKKPRGTRVRIKKDSKVKINGALCTLLHDVLVETNESDILMGKE